MAKFYGKVGYAETTEVRPGVWEEQITDRDYYGEITRNKHRRQSGDGLNDDLNISHEISIVADPFAFKNYQLMKYVEILGTKWRITDVEIQYPRLILTVGGVYNVGSDG